MRRTLLINRRAAAVPTVWPNTVAFNFTGSDQTLVVPPSANWIRLLIWGAGGGGGEINVGGGGGFTELIVATSQLPSLTLSVVVGEGGVHDSLTRTYGNGGAGGAGVAGGSPVVHGASGGGLSGVFNAPLLTATAADAIAIAGAGGGAPGREPPAAGAGGGLIGEDGGASSGALGGGGGSQVAGGAAGSNGGNAGTQFNGGDGGNIDTDVHGGGGGGGGWFGGGGGGSTIVSSLDTPGGGGSGYVSSSMVIQDSTLTAGTGSTTGNASDPNYVAGVGVGGGTFSSGGNGLVVVQYD